MTLERRKEIEHKGVYISSEIIFSFLISELFTSEKGVVL